MSHARCPPADIRRRCLPPHPHHGLPGNALRNTLALLPLLPLLSLVSLSGLAADAQAASRSAAPVVRHDQAPDEFIYGRREDVVAFARQAAAAQGLDADWAVEALAQARYRPAVARLVMPAATPAAKNWAAYRARFIEPQRIQAGLRWWNENETWLRQAERRWGVPAELVVAVVGVETFYGRIRGRYKVVDALATLSFDFPSGRSDRSGFYRDELAAFLRWCADEGRDPQSVLGSYAGAMGLPQFMPSTLLRHAVDFDGDGRIDLENSAADTAGSIAHYLAQHGWQTGLPTHYAVEPPDDAAQRARLLVPDILPSFSAAEFAAAGARLDERGRVHDGPLALVQLFNGDDPPSYVAGTRNFYVVTRYNWSSYYALAVIDLARSLRGLRPQEDSPSAVSAGSRPGDAPASAPASAPATESAQAGSQPAPAGRQSQP